MGLCIWENQYAQFGREWNGILNGIWELADIFLGILDMCIEIWDCEFREHQDALFGSLVQIGRDFWKNI